MNEDYNTIEPGTDLGLGLGYSDLYVQGRLNGKSGVGANAGSMADVKYVATDSLSELVWSPQKGLSLRCADSSFNDRKKSKLCYARPNTVSSALPQSRTAEKSNKLPEDEIIIPSRPEISLKHISESKDTLNRTASGDAHLMASKEKMLALERGIGSDAKEIDSRVEFPVAYSEQRKDLEESQGVDIMDCEHIPVDGVPAIKEDICRSSFPVHAKKINETPEKRDEVELEKVQFRLLTTDPIGGDRHEGSGDLTAGKDVLHRLEECKLSVFPPTILGKWESSAENDMQNMNDRTAGCEGSKTIATESGHEVRDSNQEDEKNNCKDKGNSASPANSRISWEKRKGKEKALSDGDVNGRRSNNEDSCGSVESCSSSFFSKCKRRWSFEQQLIVGSKRVKKQDDNASAPTSNLGQDSSFLNWISNMIKGSSQSIQVETPSLDLTLAKPDSKRGDHNEEHATYKKSHDLEFNTVGFHSIFRSLYGPITRREEEGINAKFQTKEGAGEIEVINKSCDVNAAPIACYRESDDFGKQLVVTNENVMEFASGNGATPLIQPKDSSEISHGSHRSLKTGTQENRCSTNPIATGKKGEVGNTSGPPKSLWITRFASKTSGLMLNPENCNQNTKDDSQCSMHSARLSPCPQKHVDFHPSTEDLDTAVSKEQCYTANTVASPCHKEFKSHNEQESIMKLNTVLPSPGLRSSEAMASVFARRLGAFKHIIPSVVTENAGHNTVTCFFCGNRGHRLQDCSKITEREVDVLAKNLNLCNEADELPCLCIRCFQLDHWAIACPNGAARGQQKPKPHASLTDHYDTGEMQLNSGIGLNAKSQLTENRKLEGVAPMLEDTDDPNTKADLRLECKVSEELGSAAESIPKFSEKSLKGNEMVNVDSFMDKQKSDMPQVVFAAVKQLRLSRNDILKFMKSQMSLSHLEGFFLRIRLGKWEDEVGTHYHVACIRGLQPARNSISVIVRGIECQVQSQYISNHDFLEDELMAWWLAASKDSGAGEVLPLAADLRVKVKMKKELGL